MDCTEKVTKAANTLISEATLDELRELAQDLRALSPDSALAELVEAKIAQISAEGDWDEPSPLRSLKRPKGQAQAGSIRQLSEIPGPHDPVTDHEESAEEEGADDPTNGWIPDHMGVSTVRWAHGYLAAAEQYPAQHTEEGPCKGKVDNVPFNRGRSLVHAIL
jgi:hypothetical protein